MTNKTVLSMTRVVEISNQAERIYSRTERIRLIEQAVLQSPEIQQLHKDAERYRKIANHCFGIKVTHDRTLENKVQRLVIDVRKTTLSSSGWVDEQVDAMELES